MLFSDQPVHFVAWRLPHVQMLSLHCMVSQIWESLGRLFSIVRGELHLYLEDGQLKCTGILRMQNASIFPKNIHFFATLIDHVATELGTPVGEYTHWITNLCHDRSAVSC